MNLWGDTLISTPLPVSENTFSRLQADLKKQLLITFCTENLGVTPVGVKLLFPKIIKGNPRAAPNSNKNCHRALVFFTTPVLPVILL
jgi:hypothetical protein